MSATLRVVGGGLAGCEAAWQAAEAGVDVELVEMRPLRRGPAHQSDALAELVCSNSLRGAALENAVGLLKEELARLDSLIVSAARACAVPAGGALAVDRLRFAADVESRLSAHPRVRIVREEVCAIDTAQATIVACGPLPSEALSAAIDALLARVPAAGSSRSDSSTTLPISARSATSATRRNCWPSYGCPMPRTSCRRSCRGGCANGPWWPWLSSSPPT